MSNVKGKFILNGLLMAHLLIELLKIFQEILTQNNAFHLQEFTLKNIPLK